MGIIYYKLNTNLFEGDVTHSGCTGLKGNEIDSNFNFLRGYDIESAYYNDSTNELTLVRTNGEELKVNLSVDCELNGLSFEYNKDNGELSVIYNGNELTSVSGFPADALVEVHTDNTLKGDGTIKNPLGVNPGEKTGTYAPAETYIDLTDPHNSIPEDIKPGYRILTKENIKYSGNLYSKAAMEAIQESLNGSDWRIPSKEDWDILLNSFETEQHKNHNDLMVGELGYSAGQILKSEDYWNFYEDNDIENDGTCGFDYAGFEILPVGIYNEGDASISKIGEESTLWTTTSATTRENYVKTFAYDLSGVKQEIKNGFFAIRLVKDYVPGNYFGFETILGNNYTTQRYGNQIWITTNLYAGKRENRDLIENGEDQNYIQCVLNDTTGENVGYFINEWDGSNWHKKQLSEGDSIVILDSSPSSDEEAKYKEWRLIDGELYDFEESLNKKIEEAEQKVDQLINDLTSTLEETIKSTIRNFLTGTSNEVSIKEKNGKLQIGFSDDAIFG